MGIDYLGTVVRQVYQVDPIRPTDYTGDGGLIHCGGCHTPRQKYQEDFTGRILAVPIMCSCRAEAYKKQQEEDQRNILENRRKSQLRDEKYRSMTFENSESEMKVARNYVMHWERMLRNNIGLLFHGNVGSGKTYMAAAIANAILDKSIGAEKPWDYYVYMNNIASMVHMVNDYKNGGYEECMYYVEKSSLLVIDDMGVENSNSGNTNEKVYEIVEKRMESKKPLIVTTNLSLEELAKPETVHQSRIYSRLLSLQPVKVKGEDRRKEIMKSQRDDVRGLLGI